MKHDNSNIKFKNDIEKVSAIKQELTLPPNWEEVKKRFPNADEERTVVAYGDKVYCKNVIYDPHLFIHEMTHCDRQGLSEEGAKEWWTKYLTDDKFVIDEEIIAYKNQIRSFNMIVKDRNNQSKFVWAIASILSGPLYNNSIDIDTAVKRLTN